MIGGSRTCFARFPLPGLSYPVSFSVGIGTGNFACAKGIFTLCAFRPVPECCGTASPRAPPRTALHVWTDLRGYALSFQQPSSGSSQESITVRLRSTTDAGLSPGKGLLDFFSLALPPVLGASALFVWLAQVRSLRFWPQFRYPATDCSFLLSRVRCSNWLKRNVLPSAKHPRYTSGLNRDRESAESVGCLGGILRTGR